MNALIVVAVAYIAGLTLLLIIFGDRAARDPRWCQALAVTLVAYTIVLATATGACYGIVVLRHLEAARFNS